MRLTSWLGLGAVLALVGCAGGTDFGETAASSGSGGSAQGGSAQGGSAQGGSAEGGSAQGGSAEGGSAQGGAAQGGGGSNEGGSGGTPDPAVAECVQAEDCKLIDDCCTCASIPNQEPAPACGNQECIISTCPSLLVTNPSAACAAGKCVTFECDASKVMCKKLPPQCPTGQTPAVVDTCWGGCVPITECRSVEGCGTCITANLTCVTDVTQLGPVHHCVELPAACNGKPTCACMGSSVCVGAFNSCAENANGGVSCSCPAC